MRRGYLFLIGGAEDKKDGRNVLKHILSETRAGEITIIPTASAYPRDVHRCYDDALRSLGTTATRCLDIRNEGEADTEENLKAVEEADLIYFSGGDQVRLVSNLIRTKLLRRIRQRYEAGELHIAGTSAGAAAAGNPMIYNGDYKGFRKGSIQSSQGFGLVDGITVDTHFLKRRRLSRLSQFLISGRCEKGIGLDENTGIMIYPNHQFVVIGTGMVTVMNSARVTGSNYHQIGNGDTLSFNNMSIGFLSPGTRFSIKKWAILKN